MNQHIGKTNSQIKSKNLIKKNCHATSRKQVEDFPRDLISFHPSYKPIKIWYRKNDQSHHHDGKHEKYHIRRKLVRLHIQ